LEATPPLQHQAPSLVPNTPEQLKEVWPMATSRIALVGVLIIVGGLFSIPVTAVGGESEKGDECQALDKVPELVSQALPVYPERARKESAEGKVLLGLRDTAVGKVDSVVVKQGVDGYPELADAAVAAARQWLFKPGEIKGTPVTAWVVVPVMFKLDNEKKVKPE